MKLKTIISALALGAMATAGGSLAAAAQQTNVNVYDSNGDLIAGNVTAFDWAEFGSGVAKNIGPFGTSLVGAEGTEFDFLYQANLVNMDGVTTGLVTTANGGDLSGGVQFTVVASIREKILHVADVGGGVETATFGVVGGTISIFYDDSSLSNTQANRATGEGFADGLEIARFTLTSGISNFTKENNSEGNGSASLDFELVAALDFVNSDFLQGILDAVMDLHFHADLIVPPGTSATTAFHLGIPVDEDGNPVDEDPYPSYSVGPNDIVFKVDGDNTFTTKVPEPATLGLLGAGLLGLCVALRRRSPAA